VAVLVDIRGSRDQIWQETCYPEILPSFPPNYCQAVTSSFNFSNSLRTLNKLGTRKQREVNMVHTYVGPVYLFVYLFTYCTCVQIIHHGDPDGRLQVIVEGQNNF
jgi:hypothetical protein